MLLYLYNYYSDNKRDLLSQAIDTTIRGQMLRDLGNLRHAPLLSAFFR
jgi:hypothetical protein